MLSSDKKLEIFISMGWSLKKRKITMVAHQPGAIIQTKEDFDHFILIKYDLSNLELVFYFKNVMQ